jgi:hypothetical protein
MEYKRINLDHIDVHEVLDELSVDYRESGKNVGHGWVGICCPFCGDDTGYHLGMNIESKTISCFRCGKTGNLITFVAKEMQTSFPKTIEFLKKFIPIELQPISSDTEVENLIVNVELPKNATRNPSKYQINYLKYRRYNWKKLHKKYNLHYCGPVGDFANRIIVPVYRRKNY